MSDLQDFNKQSAVAFLNKHASEDTRTRVSTDGGIPGVQSAPMDTVVTFIELARKPELGSAVVFANSLDDRERDNLLMWLAVHLTNIESTVKVIHDQFPELQKYA